MQKRIFVMNTGSSSIKIACYLDEKQYLKCEARHDAVELSSYPNIYSQLDYRYECVLKVIEENNIDLSKFDAIACRGGFLKPIVSGTYSINEAMLEDLKYAKYGEHACNVGVFIAKRLSEKYKIPAYITNPVSVDEFMPISYITGIPEIRRISKFHALNQKAAAQKAAEKLGKEYDKCKLIVVHLGGGISVGVHDNGKVIDASNPAEEGPMCTDRAGGLPVLRLIDFCYSGKLTHDEMVQYISRKSGLFAYTGTTDLIEIEKMAEKDENIKLLLDCMIYRIAFQISGYAAAVYGNVDAVVLTGGMAKSDIVVNGIKERIGFLAPVIIYPGEFEMEALNNGTLDVLNLKEIAKEY